MIVIKLKTLCVVLIVLINKHVVMAKIIKKLQHI